MNKKLCRLIFLLLPLLSSCTTTPRQDIEPRAIKSISISGATVAFYEVYGITAEDVRAQLDLLGPVDETGHSSHAATHWRISWTWPGYQTPTGDLLSATVTMRAMVVLPRWIPPVGAIPADIEKWNTYLQALAEHEGEHVRLAAEGRDAIELAIKNSTPEEADREAYRYLAECRRRNAIFDEVSGHGAAHGLKFP